MSASTQPGPMGAPGSAGAGGGPLGANGATVVNGAVPGNGVPLRLDDVHATAQRIAANISRVLVGKPDAVRVALIALLAEGHLLVEDVPGVGKTSLARALARSIDCTVSRIQFTPDLLPSDITGVSIYNRSTTDFEFRPGPVFANVVVGDEINRASPKTQSALLECMEERQVTVDGTSYPLHAPFMVIATQNPVEMEGTYVLPEAQRDRFTARISLGYPDPAAELAMVDEHANADPFATLAPVSTAAEVRALADAVRALHVAPDVRRYVVDVVSATRRLPELRLGASPRATLQLVRAARAQAALAGRDFVVPDDVHAVAQPVLAHRLVLSAEAQAARRSPEDLVRAVLARVPVPQGQAPGRGRARPGPVATVAGARRVGCGRPRRCPVVLPLPGAVVRRVPGGLTTRGRCLLAAGLAAALCALVLDERDLLRVAAFVVVLPLLAVLLAGRAQLRLRADRRLVPPRIAVGAPAQVRLAVSSTGRWGAGGLLLEDAVPYVLGEHPRFVVERLPRGAEVVLSYPLRPALRGIHPLGPLVARTTDPFGLAEFRSELGGTDRLVVTPVVVPLRGVPRGGGAGSGDEGAGRLHSGQGEDDVVVRGYRQGDDLRRVHWRSTARRDELMVRVEERPWRGGVTLLLDTRSVAHRGAGAAASLERAVSLAASAALHLQRHGQRVRLVTEGGRVLAGGPGAEDAAGDALLDALAAVAPSHQRELAGGPALAGGQEVVAVLGSVGQAAVQQLVEHRPRGRRSSAVLLDVRTWAGAGTADAGVPDPDDAARLLTAAGWTVTVARRSDSLGAVWAALASSAPQPAGVR